MKSKLKLVLSIAFVVFVLDHLTKWLIVQYVPQGTEIVVLPHFFDIVHGRNTGAAFGIMAGWDSPLRNWFFYGVGVVAAVFLYYYVKSVPKSDRVSLFALGLIFGGALGNVTDRMLRNSVVDFLSVHYYQEVWNVSMFGYHLRVPLIWPAFNVADAAITVAVVLLIVQSLRGSGSPLLESPKGE